MNSIFSRGPSLQIRLFCAVLVSLASIVADARLHLFDGVRVYLDSLVSPLIYLANSPRQLADNLGSQLQSRSSLIDENKKLEQQLFLLRSDLLRLKQVTQENERLRELLSSPVRKDSRKMVAEILAVDSDPFVHQVVIDRGERNGVFNGQPVVNDSGVVGQVISVGKTTSRVLLISDVSHGIPVRVLRTEMRAIASGTGNLDELELKNIPRSADIKKGDQLITSG
ncbi:MAG: rod shape-determining protein MreC, partial [Aeromonadaceae bacterium]|nr:rod shape-determining protein MreC [Aeromonadaceae bacterium]